MTTPPDIWGGKNPPPRIRALLEDTKLVERVTAVYDDVEKVILELQRAAPASVAREDLSGAMIAMAQILAFFDVIRAKSAVKTPTHPKQ